MTKITVLAQHTRVSREYGGHLGPTVNEGTPVRNIAPRATGWVFEYADHGIHWKLAFVGAAPATKEVDAE